MNPLLQVLSDKPSSRQSFLYTGPSTDLDSIQNLAATPPAIARPSGMPQPRASGENGGVPRPVAASGDGPKMVSVVCVCVLVGVVGIVQNGTSYFFPIEP